METSNDKNALGKAAHYRARLGAADCSEEERESCAQWRKQDDANERAFRQVADTAEQISQALASDDRFKALLARALTVEASDETDLSSGESRAVAAAIAKRLSFRRGSQTVDNFRRRKSLPVQRQAKYVKPFAIAAGLVLATVAIWVTGARSVDNAQFVATEVLTAPDKSARQVTLSDGSVVHIDAGAKLSVAMHPHRRDIHVLSGRAFFEVAHDTTRPFVVTANNTETTALGTQFEVQADNGATTVTLVEGSVAVNGTNSSHSWSERLIPGNQLRVSEGSTERARSAVDIDSVVGWSRGWLIFRGTKLGDALREINRYSSRQVTLAEGSLADMTVAGSFIAGESDSIVSAIAEVLPIRVVDGGSREIILFKRYER